MVITAITEVYFLKDYQINQAENYYKVLINPIEGSEYGNYTITGEVANVLMFLEDSNWRD